MAKDHILFDTTDAGTIAASDSVGAFVRSNDGTLITHHNIGVSNKHLDVYAALAAGDGTPITQTGGALDVNIANGTFNIDTDLDGIYVALTNADPDNVGLIAHTRSLTPTDAEQVQRTTASTADQDAIVAAQVHALDVNAFGMVYNGTTWDRLTGTSGSLNVNVTASTGPITVTDSALANTAIVSNTRTLPVAGTAAVAVASPLAARKYLWLYNFSNQKVYIGGAGVTLANGFPISPGSYMELRAGVASPVNFVGEAGKTPEIRTLEMS